MSTVTLTTDLGLHDFYVAALKGNLLKHIPQCLIIDVTHNIPNYDINAAAFTVRNVFNNFPKGTVHLIGIDCVYNPAVKYAAVLYRGHYFVGADNGVFSLLFDGDDYEAYEINLLQDRQYLHFPLLDVFVKVAAHLAQAKPIKQIGERYPVVMRKVPLAAVVDEDKITGSVVYIDGYGNAITNIHRDEFIKAQRKRAFELTFRRFETINTLSWHYNEVSPGEKLCLFGISNYLEIAINKGNASGLLGLGTMERVYVKFL